VPCNARFIAVEAVPVEGVSESGTHALAVSVLGFVGKPVLYSIIV
jgi:hypothetical protein